MSRELKLLCCLLPARESKGADYSTTEAKGGCTERNLKGKGSLEA